MLNSIILYRMLFKLKKPFHKWDAYKLGIIDEMGNIIYNDKLTSKQKKAWTQYDIFVRNIKRLIKKLPGGTSSIGTYAAIMALLKEDKNIIYHSTEKCQQELFEHYYNIVIEETGVGALGSSVSSSEPTVTTKAIPDKIKIDNKRKRKRFTKYIERPKQYNI